MAEMLLLFQIAQTCYVNMFQHLLLFFLLWLVGGHSTDMEALILFPMRVILVREMKACNTTIFVQTPESTENSKSTPH